MDALILAGGLGTRMRAVLHDHPKCMASIAGIPFLDYLLLQLKKHQVTDVILCLGHRGELIREHCQRSAIPGLRLVYSHEPEPLGTGGALKRAEFLIHTSEFLVLNGDSFFDIDLRAFIRSHQSRKARATIALAEVEDRQRYGAVEMDEQGRITGFLEKARSARGLINGGIYLLRSEVLALIPPGRAVSLEREIFPQIVGRGFYGTPFQSYFADIGVPEAYRRLQADPRRLLAAVA
jgi:D-glycero-alpha-D-manno-heptose 1-phosphate guanylyltransferase